MFLSCMRYSFEMLGPCDLQFSARVCHIWLAWVEDKAGEAVAASKVLLLNVGRDPRQSRRSSQR
jgi:hypothetical protein